MDDRFPSFRRGFIALTIDRDPASQVALWTWTQGQLLQASALGKPRFGTARKRHAATTNADFADISRDLSTICA